MFLEGLDIYNYEEELGNLLEKYGPNVLGCFLFSCNSFSVYLIPYFVERCFRYAEKFNSKEEIIDVANYILNLLQHKAETNHLYNYKTFEEYKYTRDQLYFPDKSAFGENFSFIDYDLFFDKFIKFYEKLNIYIKKHLIIQQRK